MGYVEGADRSDPLHKPSGLAVYHPQLSYCISQYVEKDPETVIVIVQGLIRYWPCELLVICT